MSNAKLDYIRPMNTEDRVAESLKSLGHSLQIFQKYEGVGVRARHSYYFFFFYILYLELTKMEPAWLFTPNKHIFIINKSYRLGLIFVFHFKTGKTQLGVQKVTNWKTVV